MTKKLTYVEFVVNVVNVYYFYAFIGIYSISQFDCNVTGLDVVL